MGKHFLQTGFALMMDTQLPVSITFGVRLAREYPFSFLKQLHGNLNVMLSTGIYPPKTLEKVQGLLTPPLLSWHFKNPFKMVAVATSQTMDAIMPNLAFRSNCVTFPTLLRLLPTIAYGIPNIQNYFEDPEL